MSRKPAPRKRKRAVSAKESWPLQDGRIAAAESQLPWVYARIDRRGEFVFASDSYERYFGNAPASLIGRSVRDAFGAAMADLVEPRIAQAWAGSQSTAEISGKLADGKPLVGYVTFVPEFAPDESVHSVVSVFFDTSEGRRLTAAAKAAEEHLRVMIDLEPECVKLVGSDGTLLEMNAAGLSMLEVENLEQAQASGLLEFIVPEHRDAFARLHRRVIRGESGTLEFQLVGRKGTRRWLETHAVPYRRDGRVTGLLGITRDVTAAKTARDELADRERRLSTLISNLPGFAYRCRNDPQYTTEYVSEGVSTLSGYVVEDFRQGRRQFGDLIQTDDRERVWSTIQAALQRNEPFEVTYRITTSTGEVRWMWERGRAVRDAANEVEALEGFVTDVTARVTSESALRETTERLHALSRQLLAAREAERRQLANELHDEMGQTLSAAKLNLESMIRFPDAGAAATRLSTSIATVDRAIQQVRSLSLQLRPPMLDDFGLAAACQWLTEQYESNVTPVVTLTNQLGAMRFDAAIEITCYRIAQEALGNAAKHAGACAVSIQLEVVDGMLHLSVRDDGMGFDVRAARIRAVRGNSVGLLSMEERASLLGGRLEWNSAPGGGTTVHAWLPATAVGGRRSG